MTEKVTDANIIENLSIYVQDGIQIHTMMRDIFLEKDNVMGMAKHQGSLDSLRDITRIIAGEKIATLAEMQADIKKQQAGDQNYLR
jgi:hypothetical protein